MKKSIFLAISLILATNCFTQKIQVGSTWQYDQIDFGPNNDNNFSILKITKDTLVNDTSYLKMEQSYLDGTKVEVFKYFLIRSEKDKIYVLNQKENKEYLLYDFTLKLNDISSTYSVYGFEKELKYKVDSIYFNQYYQRNAYVVKMKGNESIYFSEIIVGIGDISFFFPTPGFVDPPFGGTLFCYSDPSIAIPANSKCLVKSNDVEKIIIELSPNPVQDFINVKGIEFKKYAVYNSLGKEELNGICELNNQIKIGSLPSGLYFLKLFNGKQFTTKKFIKF